MRPGQHLTVAQSSENTEGPHGSVVVTTSPRDQRVACIDITTLHPDAECRDEQRELLVEAGWAGTETSLTCSHEDSEALARSIVDDAFIATWDVVHPAFLAATAVSQRKP
ncbi:TY-Chap domain-containing protein [Williamsia sp. MIQD14]|uniref:TY-Chap domain-containing protein n=1 Tax=Williamsia sp. MIQD14 TaxID=3425703 RepID=UPI003DA10972